MANKSHNQVQTISPQYRQTGSLWKEESLTLRTKGYKQQMSK